MTAKEPGRKYLIGLSVGALGVVYGDIGTSPLYAFRECFNGPHQVDFTEENVLGVLSLVVWLAHRAGHARVDGRLRQSTVKFLIAGAAMTATLWLCAAPAARLFHGWTASALLTLALLGVVGGAVYGAIIFAMFGRAWLLAFRTRRGSR